MVAKLDLETLTYDAATRRTLSSLSLAVAKSKRIVVITGAGISCSCGIPDFRSGDGLYALVKKQYPDVVLKGRDLFDSSLFRNTTSTSVFYTFISQLKQSIDNATPSPTHHFIKTLDTKKKLLRSYTQNIDGLEERAGLLGCSSQDAKACVKGKLKLKVNEVRNVQLHGDIHRVRCTLCSADLPCTEEYLRLFDQGLAPDCTDCSTRSAARQARAARALRIGTLRPAIVLYDEPHPLGDEIGTIQTADVSKKPDMLIIMGTSLKVHGLKKLVKDFAKAVHGAAHVTGPPTPSNAKSWVGKVIFVNKTPPGTEWNGIIDYYVEGESDLWTDKVLDDWRKMRPADWETQQTLVATGSGEGGLFKSVKETGDKGKGKKPLAPGMENVPPLDDDILNAPLTIKIPPPSPSKRRKSLSHYSDVECSPPKKHDSSGSNIVLEERGMLFGNATNSRARETDDETDHAELPPPRAKALRRSGSKGKGKCKAEVVIPSRPQSRQTRRKPVEAEVDIFS